MKRQEAREIAFAVVFEKEINGNGVDEILENANDCRDIIADDYVLEVSNGVFDNIDEIDEIIKSNIKGWSIDRLSKVTLALLRLAIFEIKYMSDIPSGVSVNEAVELCKKYGGEDDFAYLNGVLGSVVKSVCGE